MKHYKILAGWVAIGVYLLLISGAIAEKQARSNITGIRVIVTDSLERNFTGHKIVRDQLLAKHGIVGQPMNSINLRQIENEMLRNRSYKGVQAYISGDGMLNVRIGFREPVVRVINQQLQGYYLDAEGFLFTGPLHFTPHVLVANGYIKEPFNAATVSNINEVQVDRSSRQNRVITDLLALSTFIYNHDFWRAQIAQVYVNQKKEFELIPRVGAHIIYFGPAENMEAKFSNLWLLYNEGFAHRDWNDYIQINLKYSNQIICTKR